MLDIVGRQRALNFPPGTRWSYSNTGYNLAAIIVSRVSGESFAEFTRKRIFEPLGMTRTSWRDDYTRIVKDRAIAYADRADGFGTDMPFENVHGNGGLLTTVGDLLQWNENFVAPKVGDAGIRRRAGRPRAAQRRPRARATRYGLMVGTHKGCARSRTAASTAGYRAYLVAVSGAERVGRRAVQRGHRHAATACTRSRDLYLADRAEAGDAAAEPHSADGH